MTLTMDTVDQVRFAVDSGNAVSAQIGMNRYKCFLVTITNAGGTRPAVGGSRARTDTRITIGPTPYSSIYPDDGYLNPSVVQTNGKQIVLQNGRFSDNEIILGPLTYPYSLGGFDPNLFQPTLAQVVNTQVYVRLFGEGMDQTNGCYFTVVWLQTDAGNLTYTLKLHNTGSIPA